MKLSDYIKKHYNGVVLRAAKANGMKRQQLEQNLKAGHYHVVEIDGELTLVIAKRKLAKPYSGN